MGSCYSCRSNEASSRVSDILCSMETSPTERKGSIKRVTPYSRVTSSTTGVDNAHSNNNFGVATNFGFGYRRKNPVTFQSTTTNNIIKKYEQISLKEDSKNNLNTRDNQNDTRSMASAANRNVKKSGIQLAKVSANDKNSNLQHDNANVRRSDHQVECINNNLSSSQRSVNSDKSSCELSRINRSSGNHQKSSLTYQRRNEMLKKQFLGNDFVQKNEVPTKVPAATSISLNSSHKSGPKSNITKVLSLNEKSSLSKSGTNRVTYCGSTVDNVKQNAGNEKTLSSSQSSLDDMSKVEKCAKSSSKIPGHSSALPRPYSAGSTSNANSGRHADKFITISYKATSRLASSNLNRRNVLSSNETQFNNDLTVQPQSVKTSSPVQTSATSASVESKSNIMIVEHDSGLGCSMKSESDQLLDKSPDRSAAELNEILDSSGIASPTLSSTSDKVDGINVRSVLQKQKSVDGSIAEDRNAESPIKRIVSSYENVHKSPAKSKDELKILEKEENEANYPKGTKNLSDNEVVGSLKSNDVTVDGSVKESCSSSRSSVRTGTFSPTSDVESLKNDFLIDDEIADQPSLIFCDDLSNNSLMMHSVTEPQKTNRSLSEDRSKDDSFANELSTPGSHVKRSLSLRGPSSHLKSPAHPVALSLIAAHRQSTGSMMSSCSSINSDDLMMDYDTDRFNDFDDEEPTFKPSRAKHQQVTKQNSNTINELNQLVADSQPSMVRQRLAAIRNRSRTASASDIMTQSLTEMTPRNRSLSSPLKPPRPIKLLADSDSMSGSIRLDPSSHRSLCQDITNVKTMLFRLKRLLHDADTLNPFETNNWKNSVYQRVASFETNHGLSTCHEEDIGHTSNDDKLMQEVTDLRRQIVFLEQQAVDKDRTIKLLQQQMTKYANGLQKFEDVEKCNAATQTIKQMRTTTSMDTINPTTVSNTSISKMAAIHNNNEEKLSDVTPVSKLEEIKESNRSTRISGSSNVLPSRSVSASHLPRAPSTSSMSSQRSRLSQPAVNSQSQQSISEKTSSRSSVGTSDSNSSGDGNQQRRSRAGAFSSNQSTRVTTEQTDKKSDTEKANGSGRYASDKDDGRVGLAKNTFARNSGRFLSLFKSKKNTSTA